MASLYELTGDYLRLLELMEDPDVDPEVLKDTLEGLDGDIEAKMDACAAVKLELESSSEKLDKEIKRLQKKKKTVDNNIDRLRENMKLSMIAMGKEKIQTLKFLFVVKKNAPKLEIVDEKAVPDDYKIPQPSKIDAKKLLAFVKEQEKKNQPLPYAKTEVGTSLLIK